MANLNRLVGPEVWLAVSMQGFVRSLFLLCQGVRPSSISKGAEESSQTSAHCLLARLHTSAQSKVGTVLFWKGYFALSDTGL